MAKAPSKPPVRRQVRQSAPALNPSRAAGAPVPASAAATAPRPGEFYDPGGQGASPATRSERIMDGAALQGLDREPVSPLRAAHTADVAARSIQHDGLGASVDVEVAAAAHAGAPDAAIPANESLEQQVARIRTMRKPLGSYSQKLALDQRPGYHRHWFNDAGDRIGAALNNGWAHVKGRDGQPLHRAVGTGRDKGVLYAYAMEIPKVFWEEDMAERHRQAAEKVAALKTSPGRADGRSVRADKSDGGKFYNPAEETGRDFIEVSKG